MATFDPVDPFTAADNTLLPTYSTDWVLLGSSANNFYIKSNKAAANGSSGTTFLKNVHGSPLNANYAAAASVKVHVPGTDIGTGLCVRLDASGNAYAFRWNAGNWWLERIDAYAPATALATPSTSPLSADTERTATMGALGSTIFLQIDSVTIAAVTDTTYSAAGLPGVYARFPTIDTATIDNFTALDIATGTTSASQVGPGLVGPKMVDITGGMIASLRTYLTKGHRWYRSARSGLLVPALEGLVL